MSASSDYVFASEIMLSHKSALINVQLAGEMAAAEAALNIWFVEVALRELSGAQRDRLTDPIDRLGRECRAVWARYEMKDGFSSPDWIADLMRVQTELVDSIWDVLPPEFRPHPPGRRAATCETSQAVPRNSLTPECDA